MAALGRVRLSPWLMVLFMAGAVLGEGMNLAVGLICVLMHEMAHAAAASALGAQIENVEIAPFGGVVRLRGMENLSAAHSVLVALAGPALSGMLAAACAFMAQWIPQAAKMLAHGVSINAGLMLFNLLPAYPMDGGRVLCALMRGRCGQVRAQRFAAALGIFTGGCVVLLGVLSMFLIGRLNLTLLLGGGYLIAAAFRARQEAPYTRLQQLLGRERALEKGKILPVRTMAVRRGIPDQKVMMQMQPGALYHVVYLDEEMRICGEKWEGELLQAVLHRCFDREKIL